MDNKQTRSWLDEQWKRISHDRPEDPVVDRLVNSRVVSVRYALPTQILGKIANPSRDILAIQAAGGKNGWDARSFAKNVIVPWVTDNRNILGTSTDPYVGKPLRRERLDSKAALKNPDLWNELVNFLKPLETAGRQELENALRRCLESIARRGRRQDVQFIFPQRISLERLCEMTEDFFRRPSGGLRPMAVCVSLMEVIGDALDLFDEVASQGINEADAQSDVPADIMCYKDGVATLVVEVKDRTITMDDCASTMTKARGDNITGVLFATPGIKDGHENAIRAFKGKVWREGRNLYHTDIVSIMRHVFVLLDEKWRIVLIKRISDELKARGRYEDRAEWSEQCMAS